MCCLMITTVWNVVMLRSNLIYHGGRWTRIISTTDNDCSEMPFFNVLHVYGWICGISETVLITMYDIPELHDYLSPPPFSLSFFRVQSLSLSHQSIPLSFSLFLSVKHLSLSFSLTSFLWLYTNLISISFVLWTSLYKDIYIFKQKFEWVNEMQTVNITFV